MTEDIDILIAEDDMEPLDELETVLDRVLGDRPELDAVVGDWDLLLGIEEPVRNILFHVLPLAESQRLAEPPCHSCWKYRLRAQYQSQRFWCALFLRVWLGLCPGC